MTNDYVSIRESDLLQLLQLNTIFTTYKSGKTTFEEIYAATKVARDRNREIVVGQGYGDEAAALTLFDDVLLKLIQTDNIPDFERALNVRLRRRRIDLLRKTKRHRTKTKSLDEMVDGKDEDDGAATPEVIRSDYDLEHDVLRKKEADHRQVIDFLIRDGNPDATTTVIVEAYLVALPSASDNAIAKSLGLHHQIVKRKLTALARKYDATRFGDISDYLAV
jgi:hypothetical protein